MITAQVNDAADCFDCISYTWILTGCRVLNYIAEIEIPDPPNGFTVERVDLCGEV